jgi:molybdopterin converting factor small subunit
LGALRREIFKQSLESAEVFWEMALTVFLSGHLKNFAGGELQTRLDNDSDNVAGALESLWKIHPALRDRVLNEQGEIRQHVNIFVGSDDVKHLKGLQTRIDPGSELHIFNAVSGG